MSLRLTQSQIETIHKVVKVLERDEKGRITKVSGVSKAAQILKVSRPTIYKALELYPEVPTKAKRVIPQYVQNFEDSPTVKEFREKYEAKLKGFNSYVSTGREAWLYLQKDPINWEEEDYLKLWNWENFRDEQTGQIAFNIAVQLRKWMVHCKRFELPDRPEFTTKGLKRPKGAKKTHYIKTFDEMVHFVNALEFPDAENLFIIGSQCGARFSSLKEIKPQDIDYTQNVINMYETKVSKYVLRKFNPCTLNLLRNFIIDFDIQGNERLFKRGMDAYNSEFRKAGKEVGIDFNVTTHTGMKHTFVSQSSAHGVSLEVVSEQCGTDPQTIREFYLGGLDRKMDEELLGIKVIKETWKEYIEKLHPYYVQRYEQIKGNMARVDGIVKTMGKPVKVKVEKPKVKKVFSWERIESITKASEPKDERGKRLWLYWRKVWKVHEEHPRLTYEEIKERLK